MEIARAGAFLAFSANKKPATITHSAQTTIPLHQIALSSERRYIELGNDFSTIW